MNGLTILCRESATPVGEIDVEATARAGCRRSRTLRANAYALTAAEARVWRGSVNAVGCRRPRRGRLMAADWWCHG
jgi:hypothetical protein